MKKMERDILREEDINEITIRLCICLQSQLKPFIQFISIVTNSN